MNPIQSTTLNPVSATPPRPLDPGVGIDAAVTALRTAISPHAALLGAIDRVAPQLGAVQQGELARLRDDVSAARPDAAGPDDDNGGISNFLGDFNPLDRLKEIWEKLKDVLNPPETGAPLGIDKTLGADTAAIVAKSPSLTADLKALEADGWKIVYGPSGDGSFADRSTKTITIDGSEKGNPTALVQTLAHEAGHARYNYSPDYTSSKTYLEGTLGDEGEATISNIRAQREILANGGPDIGIAGNPANHPKYNAAYDRFVASGDRSAARQEIGTIFARGERTSTTGQTYEDYYHSWYRANFPGRP